VAGKDDSSSSKDKKYLKTEKKRLNMSKLTIENVKASVSVNVSVDVRREGQSSIVQVYDEYGTGG
jgi:hypothetical protein